jgi:hypothetical protein
MDDHDLPYKCLVKGCEKLPGFSRTSRLALHEREVHKMHGGYGNNFFCPFKHCERSENDGFAEKEDLADHIRLDHRQTSVSADVGRLRQNGQESDAALSTLPISGSSYTRLKWHATGCGSWHSNAVLNTGCQDPVPENLAVACHLHLSATQLYLKGDA